MCCRKYNLCSDVNYGECFISIGSSVPFSVPFLLYQYQGTFALTARTCLWLSLVGVTVWVLQEDSDIGVRSAKFYWRLIPVKGKMEGGVWEEPSDCSDSPTWNLKERWSIRGVCYV